MKRVLHCLLALSLPSISIAAPPTTQPAYEVVDAHTLSAESLLPVEEAAASLGFRLYEGVGGVTLVPQAAFDPTPVVFRYAHQTGLYPEFKNEQPVNGGTPIGMDLPAHLRETRLKLLRSIGNLPADSLVAFDYEVWGPTLPPEGPYRELAIQQVRERHPWLVGFDEGRQLVPVTGYLWQQGATAFFRETLAVAREVRPDLRYGFYYPQARHFWKGYATERGDELRATNDLLAETWADCDWFPASVYLFYPSGEGEGHVPSEANRQYVEANVSEWRRIEAATRRADRSARPVIAVLEPSLHGSNRYVSGLIPMNGFRLVMDAAHAAGGDGLMIWGEALDAAIRREHIQAAAMYGPVFAEWVADELAAGQD